MTSSAVFLEQLERSRLLTAAALADVQQVAARKGKGWSPEEIAKHLVDRKELTAWQARMILAGQTAFFLGKYQLLDELGHGGMGTVFKARQAPIGRVVALKVMAEKLVGDEMAVARFEREIRAAAALNHPHVVTAFDAESIQNTHFLVMEYVPGESLDAVLRREHRLPVAVACEYVRQAALGLAHAHEMGMAHRDIKPSNLLLTVGADGRPLVKILDMGLARFTSDSGGESELTATGQVMGTPDYISPEQARSTRAADIRSDIYSLGCTLFRALAGELPFGGQSVVEKLMARALEEAPPLRLYFPEAPAGLPEVVAKMLARDPAWRFQTPREVAAALQPFCNTAIDAAHGVARPEQTWSSARRQPAALADPQVNQFLQVLAHEAELDEPPSDTQSGLERTLLGDERTGAIEPSPTKGRLQIAIEERSRVDRRKALLAVAGTTLALLLLMAAWGWERSGRTSLVIDWPEDERTDGRLEVDGITRSLPENGAIPAIAGAAGRRTLHLERRGYEPIDDELAFDRGQKQRYRPEWKATVTTARRQRLAQLRHDAEAFLKRAGRRLPSSDDADLASLRRQFAEFRPQILNSPDQQAFEALWRRLPGPTDFLRAADIAEESFAVDRVLAPQPPAELVAAFGDARFKHPTIVSVVLSPDDRVAVTAIAGYPIYVWDLATGRLRFDPATAPLLGGPLAFSSDGKYLIYPALEEVVVWSLTENVQKFALAVTAGQIGDMLWIPRTNRLAISQAGSAAIEIWDVELAQVVERLDVGKAQKPLTVLAASADGRHFAATNIAGDTRLWNLARQEAFDLPFTPANFALLVFSPDGKQLARATETTIAVWNIDPLKLDREVLLPNPGLFSLDWNSDGIIRTIHANPFNAIVWNAADLKTQVSVAPRGRPHVRARITSDGKRLVTCGSGGEVQVWDALTGDELNPVPPAYTAAAVDPLGEWLALGTNARTIEIRSLPAGALLKTVPLDRPPDSIAVSPDRRFLAAVPSFANAGPGKLAIVEEGRDVRYLDDVPQPQTPVFTPDGKLLLAVDWEELIAWNTADWTVKFKRRLPSPPHGYTMAQVVVTSDGRKAIVKAQDDAGGGIVGYSLPDGKQLYVDPVGPILAMTATTNPNAFVAELGRMSHWFDAEKGQALHAVNVHHDFLTYTTSLASNPNGKNICNASSDGQLALLASESLSVERTLSLGGRQLVAREVLFTPDGRHVVTVNSNGTVYILRLEDWSPQ